MSAIASSRTLTGHTKDVTCLAILSSDKFKLASGSEDTSVKLWDLTSGSCLRTFSGHTKTVTVLNELPDGSLLSGSKDKTIKVWDIKTGNCLVTLEGHAHEVSAIAVTKTAFYSADAYDEPTGFWSQLFSSNPGYGDNPCKTLIRWEKCARHNHWGLAKSQDQIWSQSNIYCITEKLLNGYGLYHGSSFYDPHNTEKAERLAKYVGNDRLKAKGENIEISSII